VVEKQTESHPVCANHELQLLESGLPDLEKVAVVGRVDITGDGSIGRISCSAVIRVISSLISLGV
jgi:hypothetical protein